MYEPLPTQLTSDEKRFLQLVAPMGLDWLATRTEFAARYGVTRYYDWADAVALPYTTALTATPLQFRMYANEHVAQVMDLPPEYVWAIYMEHDDARANHREMERQLQARLGVAEVKDVSNCIMREWHFGIFRVALLTWPPDLRHTDMGTNALHEREPRLAIASTISLSTPYACVYPDGSLACIAERIAAARLGASTDARVDSAKGWHIARHSRRYTRRNPHALSSVLRDGEVALWRDDMGKRFGATATGTSLVFERTPQTKLVLGRIDNHHAPDSFAVDVWCETPSNPGTGPLAGACVFEHSDQRALQDYAARLGHVWDLTVVPGPYW